MAQFSLDVVPPLIGQVTAFCLFYSACPALMHDRRSGHLSIDPLPFPFAVISSLLWIVYASLIQDPWAFVPNFIGLGAALFNTVTVLRLCRDESKLRFLEWIVVVGVMMVAASVMVVMTPMIVSDFASRRLISGCLCVVIAIVLFSSPCVEVWYAIRSGDASRVSLPLACASLANGLLWSSYGLAQNDMVQVATNGTGASLALVTLVVKLSLQRTSTIKTNHNQSQLELASGGNHVTIRSLTTGSYWKVLNVPLPFEGDSEAETDALAVVSAPQDGSTIQIVAADDNRVALKTQDGRYFCVRSRLASVSGSFLNPSSLSVAAVRCIKPGEDGEFVPVYSTAVAKDPFCSSAPGVHDYQEDSICFWNPLHRVFLRVNELGEVDCSGQWNSGSTGIAIPAGWEWERFSLQRVPTMSSQGQLRSRASVVGKVVLSEISAHC